MLKTAVKISANLKQPGAVSVEERAKSGCGGGGGGYGAESQRRKRNQASLAGDMVS